MGQTFSIVLPFFALIGCGWLAGRRTWLGSGAAEGLTLFVFTFALPALIFRSAATRPLGELFEPTYALAYLLAGLFIFGFTAVSGRFLFRLSLAECAVQGQAASVGNVGFLALPLLLAVMGDEAAPPILLGWMIDMIVLVPAAITILEISKNRGAPGSLSTVAAKVIRGVSLNPFVLALTGGIGYGATGLSLPLALDTFTDLLGRAAGPVALFALGLTLAGRPLADSLKEATFLSVIKLLLYPAVMGVAMTQLFDVPPLWATAAILLAAAPVAANVYVIAASYGVYAVRASSSVLVSTAIAVVSFSVLTAWMLSGGVP